MFSHDLTVFHNSAPELDGADCVVELVREVAGSLQVNHRKRCTIGSGFIFFSMYIYLFHVFIRGAAISSHSAGKVGFRINLF